MSCYCIKSNCYEINSKGSHQDLKVKSTKKYLNGFSLVQRFTAGLQSNRNEQKHRKRIRDAHILIKLPCLLQHNLKYEVCFVPCVNYPPYYLESVINITYHVVSIYEEAT